MAGKSLKDIKAFIEGTVVTVLQTPASEYPYYYLSGEYVGWAEYIDFSNFDPFEMLGFTEENAKVEVDEAYYDEHGYDEVDSAIEYAVQRAGTYEEAVAAVEAIGPFVKVVKNK